MKLKSLLSTLIVTTATGLSLGVLAATETGKTADAPASVSTEKAKLQDRHSHVKEKTGVPQALPVAVSSNRQNPAKDPNRHLHPRDGK